MVYSTESTRLDNILTNHKIRVLDGTGPGLLRHELEPPEEKSAPQSQPEQKAPQSQPQPEQKVSQSQPMGDLPADLSTKFEPPRKSNNKINWSDKDPRMARIPLFAGWSRAKWLALQLVN